ncbi:hypothetical protein ACIBF1_42045 [Spirillospora sp. NPDC050679]
MTTDFDPAAYLNAMSAWFAELGKAMARYSRAIEQHHLPEQCGHILRPDVETLLESLSDAEDAALDIAALLNPGDHPSNSPTRLPGYPTAPTPRTEPSRPSPTDATRRTGPQATALPAGPVAKIPPAARDRMLNLLTQRGPAGARRDELVTAGGKSVATVAKWLTALREHGFITVSGATRAARYYLPQHAPTHHDP